MKTYDKFEQIAGFAKFPVAVMANMESQDFELMDLTPDISADVVQDLSERGMLFVAAIGIMEGLTKIALAEAIDAMTATALIRAYAQHVKGKVNGVAWQMKPDTRENYTPMYDPREEYLTRRYGLSEDSACELIMELDVTSLESLCGFRVTREAPGGEDAPPSSKVLSG